MSLPERVVGLQRPTSGPLLDPFGRVHTYARISVTDRCNYRCTYCMPAAGLDWMPRAHLLTYEEIARIVAALASMGVRRVRLTGGEPTIRRDIVQLVEKIAATPGIEDLSMTTNGHLFAKHARALADAGLQRINVSIDTLDRDAFRRITRGGDVERVLGGIDAALAVGMGPVKLNTVVIRGQNDDQIEPLVAHFADRPEQIVVRFIEFMPFTAVDRLRHVPAAEIRERLQQLYTLTPVPVVVGGGPGVTWRIEETGQRVGFISPITEHFCERCNRVRLQADGHLRTCLSREALPSLREVLRGGADDAELEQVIRERLWGKVAGHVGTFAGAMTSVGG